jgi:RNA polymerase sigma-70 factor, ECF subfamily
MPALALSTDTAWAELRRKVRGFVARRVREPDDVDDIVQQVFLRVHQGLPTLRDADKFDAWIFRTTRRTIIDYYRAPAKRRELSAGMTIDVVPAEASADVAVNSQEESASHELAGCLKPLLGRLAVADQEALRLVEFEGLTQVQAAGRLGLSVSGMKSRVQRARFHLRSAFDRCCHIALDRRGGVLAYESRGHSCDSCRGGA